jgi:hypothetical protein
MTRREEIEKAAFNYINSDAVSPENMQLAFGDFINGAQWADKTMIEKACEWLKFNTNWDDEWDDMGKNMNYGMIEEFRKAMEE